MHIKSNPTVQIVNRKIYTLEISYPFPREAAKKSSSASRKCNLETFFPLMAHTLPPSSLCGRPLVGELFCGFPYLNHAQY